LLFSNNLIEILFQDVVRCDYFKEIQRITTSLKGSFADAPEKLLEIRKIEQVAERNRIAANVINQLGASDPSLRVSLELTHHPHFAVVVVRRS
jgi:N-alpha-acetyltransferase 35, NatC auxiliary subunit